MALKLDKTNLVRKLAVQSKLVIHIDKFIEDHPDFEWSFEYTRKLTDDAWHPSGDCTPSLNELYHKATDQDAKPIGGPYQKRKLPASLLKTFSVGHFWHAYLQECLTLMEFAEPQNIERRGMYGWSALTRANRFSHIPGDLLWEPWQWATGSADVCPCKIPGHGDVLVDFKTMGSHDYKRNSIPAWCADKWECQANVYMDWFDLEEAIFVGINKDSPHDMKEFVFRRNQPLVEAIYAKWELAGQCITAGIEPPENEVIELPLMGPVV